MINIYIAATETIADGVDKIKIQQNDGMYNGVSFFVTGFVILVIGIIIIFVIARLL